MTLHFTRLQQGSPLPTIDNLPPPPPFSPGARSRNRPVDRIPHPPRSEIISRAPPPTTRSPRPIPTDQRVSS